MKKLLIILILIISFKGVCQDSYFLGKTNYCTPTNSDSKKKFDVSITGLNFPKYYGGLTNILVKAIEQDPKYCDAYFMAGYYFRLQNLHKEALVLYYAADSLAQNRAPIFKQNLAIEYMRFGKADKAREKYIEMTKYFPTNPEGFYGVGNTAIVLGDYDLGLKNLKIAEDLYEKEGEVKSDVKYMYGILYALKEDYRYSLPYLEEVYSQYKRDDGYLALYAISMIKNAKENNDKSLEKKAKKIYEKIKGSKNIDAELNTKLIANFQ